MSAPHFFRHCRYLFVGSGPATLGAVLSLPPGERARAVVLEAAPDRLAICPGLKERSCSSCEGALCPVVNNVGGASAPYGNKICFFPASEGVRRFSNPGFLPDADDLKSAPSVVSTRLINPDQHATVGRKLYSSDRLPMDEYRGMVSSMITSVKRLATLRSSHPVTSVSRRRDGRFVVGGDFPGTYLAENVILATGRSGHSSSRALFDEIGVEYREPSFDLGFRLEFDSSLANEAFFYQEDIKYKKRYGTLGVGRTFCSCRDGAIVPVKYGPTFFADGALLRRPTGRSNFALMARTDRRIPASTVSEWCARLNAQGGGTLRLASVDLGRTGPEDLAERISSALPEGATSDHTAILRMLVRDLFSVAGGPVAGAAADRSRTPGIDVLGPAVDQYWPEPLLRDGFATSVDGIWVIGDAAGASRGIFQAIYSGESWAARLFGNGRAANGADVDLVRDLAEAI